MLLLDGQPALSPFRIERLNDRLETAGVPIRVAAARFLYLVDADPLDPEDTARALEILEAVGAAAPLAAGERLIVPRLGTLSPWSSKATEILTGCGLPIRRVERGTRVALDGLAHADPGAIAAALAIVSDPMTESVLDALEAAPRVFERGQAGPLGSVALGPDPVAALADANRTLGLALSPDEIEYLAEHYGRLKRDPTDAELMMFAQANSEHCRHKVFNASFTIDGVPQERSLFQMIRHTHAASPAHTLSAYADNAAVIEGSVGVRFAPDPADRTWRASREAIPYAIKVETHNHPTAIAPYPGAATGSGGEIRDEGATGRGAKPKAGLVGFSVSHLRIPGLPRPWETERPLPPRMASALEIMRDGPIGAAAFNNEFGRPALAGYFRSFEVEGREPGLVRGYDKPIMLAGGLANLGADHIAKGTLGPGDAVVVIGGPSMLIGLGGGAASSVAGGDSSAELDFASVQRDNAEMQRRCQELIERCRALGPDNPIVTIHDVGAGGLSNAIPELLHDSGVGGVIELRRIPSADPSLSPMQLWCNESQERYVLGVRAERLAELEAMAAVERCPLAVVGHATADTTLRVLDADGRPAPVDLPLPMLLGKPPRMHRDTRRVASRYPRRVELDGIAFGDAVDRVLRHPTVGSKSFLVTIGDRTVGGLCHRDPMVGRWQLPVADCAVTLLDFDGVAGEAFAIGERTPLALLDAAAAARMAVGEAITNLLAAPIAGLGEVRLSANWMAAVAHPGEDAALYDAVRAVALELCPALGISIPVGKDSLSMQARWRDAGGEQRVVSPVSLIVSAFARVADVRGARTPELRLDAGETELWLLDLGAGRDRLGGSILVQCLGRFGGEPPDLDDPTRLVAFAAAVRELAARGLALAYHDRSDGGALIAALEMAFAARAGLAIELPDDADPLAALFAEELGALVQARVADRDAVAAVLARHGVAACARRFATVDAGDAIVVRQGGAELGRWKRLDLLARWHETSHAIQRLRDDPASADEERAALLDPADPGLGWAPAFDPAEDVAAPMIATGHRPRVAILREQGVNGQVEMAAAFDRAGFAAVDVHMSELVAGTRRLDGFVGLAACGGFSYGDVLGAGRGWATMIRHHPALADAFRVFLADPTRFALGVCNGCQMLAQLADLVPGAAHWPRFRRNRSEQYEARLVMVEVLESPSILLAGMAGSRLPVVVAHGEGRAVFAADADPARAHACLRYVDGQGRPAATYPANPNGSPDGLTGFTSGDGRVTILMPHPERVFRRLQFSWAPVDGPDESPWFRMFRNARVWVG
jgi:phosphoribosylformylglycinamidine synthase